MTVGPILLLAILALALGLVVGRRRPGVWLGLTLGGCAAALAAAVGVLGGGQSWEWRSTVALGGAPVHLQLDALSAIFLSLVAVVGAAGAAYAREYWSDAEHPDSAPRSRLWWNAMLLSMLFVLLAANGLHFLIAWELFAICGYFLITLDRDRPEARAAGWLYLGSSHAGTLALFAFFTLLALRTGSWELGPLSGHPGLAPLFWLALFGFGAKAGLFPLHIWLPSAHANSPSHVSALMSGLAIKMGIYGIVRFAGWLPAPPVAGAVLIGVGALTAVLGIAYALAQNDLKRLLAYCSVENMGLIAIGLGGAILGTAHADAPWGRLLLAGALLHVWCHGLFKSLLFFGAGSVLHATGTREMSRLGGLWRALPWTAGLFAFGSLAICGLPPLNGFVSEWLLYLGLFSAAAARGATAWAAMPAAIAMGVAGALALAAFVKANAVIFLGTPRTAAVDGAHECGPWMRAPMLALAGACGLIGLAPVLVWPAIARAVGAWNEPWAGTAPAAPLGTLSAVNGALAAILIGGAIVLERRVRAHGLRRGPTWSCGYAAPTARMQYTSGSFAGIVAGWFASLFRPERTGRRPHGPFPERASRIERLPDTVLAGVIEPAAALVMRGSRAARRLQHGRLQFYLVYLAGGLAAIAILMFWEARR